MLVTLAAVLAAVGLLPCVAGWLATCRFAGTRRVAPASRPPITVMKPLCGPEPGLEAALASFFEQDYPTVQLVFGVQDPADPALAVIERLQRRYPACDVTVVCNPAIYGMNRKICNLLNMLPVARYDTLVFADSDLTVAPDYLTRIQAALQAPCVGLVTTLYVGAPAVPGLAARLGAAHLTYGFLPGALLARALGRQDCLGTTMALTSETLQRIGGLRSLVDHLADDNVLGQLVGRLGLSVGLAATVPVVGVQDRRLADLWTHEMRWARTIRALAPCAYAASAIQYPIAWAMLSVVFSGGARWTLALLAATWLVRALAAWGLGRALAGRVGHRLRGAAWLLPLRDLLSLAVLLGSFHSGRVVWRGHRMRADHGAFAYEAAKPALAGDAPL